MIDRTLFIIPARGGSKGLPGKNIKKLKDKPLICYSIDAARFLSEDVNICVSTDDDAIIKCVEDYGLRVPFKRPSELALDTSGSYEVLLHAIDYYESIGKFYDTVVVLQPTSPFRTGKHIEEALKIYTGKEDMVVSVFETKANPYFVLYEQNDDFIFKSKSIKDLVRRQDLPKVYQINGAIYIMNVKSLKKRHFSEFEKIKKYKMTEVESVDVDTPLDWDYCEFLINKGLST